MKLRSAIVILALVGAAAHADDFTARVARCDVAAVVQVERVEAPGTAVCTVEETLKGAVFGASVQIDFALVPGPLRPSAGQRRVVLLVRGKSGSLFRLCGGGDAVYSATLRNIDEVIVAAEESSFASGAEEIGPRPVAEMVELPPRPRPPAPGPASAPPPEAETAHEPTPRTEPPAAPPTRRPVEIPLPGPGPSAKEAPVPELPKPIATVRLPSLTPPEAVPATVERPQTGPPAPVAVAEVRPVPAQSPEIAPAVEPAPSAALPVQAPRSEGLAAPPAQTITGDLATRVAAADLVMTGRILSVGPSGRPKERAIVLFDPEDILKGALRPAGRLEVGVPLVERGEPAWRPKRGRAVLFVSTSNRGSLRLVHPLYGVEDLNGDGPAKILARLSGVEGLRALRSPQAQASVADTIAAWVKAWNAKDLEAALCCYSSRSPLARAYHRGGADRQRLRAALAGFPDHLAVTVSRVGLAGPSRAKVSATLVQTRGELRSRRQVEMTFVLEGDRWLILREGF